MKSRKYGRKEGRKGRKSRKERSQGKEERMKSRK